MLSNIGKNESPRPAQETCHRPAEYHPLHPLPWPALSQVAAVVEVIPAVRFLDLLLAFWPLIPDFPLVDW